MVALGGNALLKRGEPLTFANQMAAAASAAPKLVELSKKHEVILVHGNGPQVGILALGAIRKRPAVLETPHGDVIAIRHMMFLSHSYDHRVVDGMLGGSFVRRVADYLEGLDPERAIVG